MTAREYAQRIMDAFVAGQDHIIWDIHKELCEDERMYLDVWSHFPSGMRRSIKELVDREKQP
jgi:hypothetical protein